jgi:hypothetical protein
MLGGLSFLAGLMPWRMLALVATVLAVIGGAYFYGQRTEAAHWREREAQHVAATQRAIAKEQQRQREIEARWQDRADLARKDLDNAHAKIAEQARRLHGLQLDAGRLRDQLATYAAGGPGPDTLAACGDRAAALATYAAELGERAARLGQLARVATIDRDTYAAQIVACVTAWPREGRVELQGAAD